MKKILVIALAVVMLVSVFALTACAKEQTVAGEYAYDNAWVPGAKYGVQVEVTVKGDIITNVKVTSTDSETYTNLSASWGDKAKWTDGQEAFLASFVGKTVAEINAIVVDCAESGQPNSVTGFTAVAGATQSSGRVILAIQNALTKLAK